MKSAIELSIIIVNYNAADYLDACLSSIESHLLGLEKEVIVVDNASTDGSLEIIVRDFPWVRVIKNSTNVGFAAATNQGVKSSQGRFILWLNPDTVLLDCRLKELLSAMSDDSDLGILGLQILNSDHSLQISGRSFPSYETAFFSRYSFFTKIFPKNPWSAKYLNSDWDRQSRKAVDWVSGAALLHKRQVWEQLHGLDEGFFMYCEDVDFCFRAKLKGWRTVYDPSCRVLHHIGGSSRRKPLRMIFEHHRSMWRYYAKNYKRNLLKDFAVGGAILIRCAFSFTMKAILK